MKSILVPVGSSKNAQSHLQYAVDFAEAFGAKLYVVQVYNVYTKSGTMIKVDHILERESLDFLNKHVASVNKKNVEVIVKTFKGKLVDTLELVSKSLDIDLIILEPRTNSIKDEVYLGKTSGKIIKQTNIPALIVPEGYVYKPINSILFALKSAVINKVDALYPLLSLKNHFNAKLNLLLVKTPFHSQSDFVIAEDLKEHLSSTKESENATTFQGVLEHYKEFNPDILCVVRRKRGFFTKMWEKNSILKKDFYVTTFPVLVLSGLK
ncbi:MULTISPECIES: universal stress protein [unclassified Olleya]|jgi:nucleotide-binding universal stress UspA family protein|uniref:universal stress protein n=1 Tax=unclassified Olleya TaxID=2615019 RepID=UPI0011A32264|nr:universal stress protein [Olleya sp. Hel_I_94]TVZ48232.1 nucleotide-binding universal stress UspA family protein [Olleya sp. Hel_I_94]|tara:strand:+ start:202121 stop:202918 length:798 start_codon:yes stop_codon:yes gene_type:complete